MYIYVDIYIERERFTGPEKGNPQKFTSKSLLSELKVNC